MAIDPQAEFPGQSAVPTVDYPHGSARDITVPGDNTGTPLTARLVNDSLGFYQALLGATAQTPTGDPETATTSQYLTAIQTLIGSALTAQMETLWPVGEIYITRRSGTPDTWLGFGTWEAYGPGQVLVGFDAGQTEFDALDKTGGAKTHTLTVDEMPSHTHSLPALEDADAGSDRPDADTDLGSPANRTTGSAGGDQPHNNLQPYTTVYFWKRTA